MPALACDPGSQAWRQTYSYFRARNSISMRCCRCSVLAVRRDAGACPLQPVGQGEGCKRRTAVRVHDVWRTKAVDGLVQRIDADTGLLGIGDAPSEHLTAPRIHVNHLWVNAVGASQFRRRPPTLQGGQRNVRLESRVIVPASRHVWSSVHRRPADIRL
jgi:hypothetical protein